MGVVIAAICGKSIASDCGCGDCRSVCVCVTPSTAPMAVPARVADVADVVDVADVADVADKADVAAGVAGVAGVVDVGVTADATTSLDKMENRSRFRNGLVRNADVPALSHFF